jgi:integrase
MSDRNLIAARSSIAKAAQAKDRPEKPYEVRADKPQGLLLRVQPSGSRTYYVQIGRGQRVRIGPAGTFTLKQAEERAKRILIDPASAAKKVGAAATLSEYLDDHYKPHALAHMKTGEGALARIRASWKPLLNKRLSDITSNAVDKLRNKRIIDGVAPATVNRDVAALSSVLTHWTKNNKGTEHPLAGQKHFKVADDETVRYLTAVEATRLRKALSDRDTDAAIDRVSANKWRADRGYELMPEISGYSDHMTPMVLLSINLGLRQGELFSLAWGSVDLSLKTIKVLASHSKGNKTRVIPLNTEALQVLMTIQPDPATGLVFKSPVTGGRFNNVKKAWAQITANAKLPDLRWHDLRHDFASQLVMRGVSLFVVQQLLGHSTPKMTMRYAKLAPDNLSDAVNLLGGGK